MFQAGAVAGKGFAAVAFVHGLIERSVGGGEGRRHGCGVVKVGEGGGGALRPNGEEAVASIATFDAGGEHSLGSFLHSTALRRRGCFRLGVVVVNKAGRVAGIAF